MIYLLYMTIKFTKNQVKELFNIMVDSVSDEDLPIIINKICTIKLHSGIPNNGN